MLSQVNRIKVTAGGPVQRVNLSMWHASAGAVWLGLFGTDQETPVVSSDYDDVLEVKFEVYDKLYPEGTALVSKTVLNANCNKTMTAPQWEAGTHASVQFDLSVEQMSLTFLGSAGRFYYVIYVVTASSRKVLVAGDLVLTRNQAAAAGVPPPVPAGYYTTTQTDALIASIVVSGGGGQVFANDAARLAATPAFVGQFGYQTDTTISWVGKSTTAGDWNVTGDARYVRNEAELRAAVLLGGLIGVIGTVSYVASTLPLDITVPNTEIFGVKLPNGTVGRIVNPHAAGQSRTVIKISARNCTLRDLQITCSHPLATDEWTSNGAPTDIGILLTDTTGIDCSNFKFRDLEIYNVTHGIFRQYTAGSYPASNGEIYKCNIHSINGFGIWIQFNTPRIHVEHNRIFGRELGETHLSHGNAMWIGNNANRASITDNEMAYFGRHGIEYWNAQGDAATVDGNEAGLIANNHIHHGLRTSHDGVGAACFCVTAFGASEGLLRVIGNICQDGTIGVEVYNDNDNIGRTLVSHNQVENCQGTGISINNATNAMVHDNLVSEGTGTNGIQIIRGCYNVSIINNTFRNPGMFGILINGNHWNIKNITASAGTGYAKVHYNGGGELYVGKWVAFDEMGGMVELNGANGQITEMGSDVDGTYVVVNIDVSTYTAYKQWTVTGVGVQAVTNFALVTVANASPYQLIVTDRVQCWGITGVAHPSNPAFDFNHYIGQVVERSDTQVTMAIPINGYTAYVSGGKLTKGRMYDRIDAVDISGNNFYRTRSQGAFCPNVWSISAQNLTLTQNKIWVKKSLVASAHGQMYASRAGNIYTGGYAEQPTQPRGLEDLGCGGGSNLTVQIP
jgi:hypothetical protein